MPYFIKSRYAEAVRVLHLRRVVAMLSALCATLPVRADTQFRARPMTRNDVAPGKGQCDIRLQVDGEVEVSVRGDLIYARTISGSDARDDGSECNEPLPSRPADGFHFEARDRRGDIHLLAEPSRSTNYQAVVRIRHSAGAAGRYHFRLTWMKTPDRGGLAWNNSTHFTERGAGTVVNGSGAQRLSGVTVDMDRGGRILVSFRTDGGRPLAFSGAVVENDRGTLRADVATDDSVRLRGTMLLSRDAHGDIYRISLAATNGQDRLHLDWDRR